MAGTASSYTPPQRPQWLGTAVTDGAGVATFNFPAGRFTAAPVVAVALQGGNGNAKFHIVTANSNTQAKVTVRQAAGVTVLSIGVLASAVVEAGVTVHLVAGDAG